MLKAAQILGFLSRSTATYIGLLLKLTGALIIALKGFTCSTSLYQFPFKLGKFPLQPCQVLK